MRNRNKYRQANIHPDKKSNDIWDQNFWTEKDGGGECDDS